MEASEADREQVIILHISSNGSVVRYSRFSIFFCVLKIITIFAVLFYPSNPLPGCRSQDNLAEG